MVNGLPLVVIELKKPGVPARAAFDENLTSYKHPQNGIPALFVFNALLIASNSTGIKFWLISHFAFRSPFSSLPYVKKSASIPFPSVVKPF